MTLPRLFYKLPELAEKWQIAVDDILQMGAANQLEISIRYNGSVNAPLQGCAVNVSSHYLQLLPHDLLEILSTHGEKGYYRIDILKLHGELVYSLNAYEPGTPEAVQDTPPLYISSCKDLLVLPDEIARAESIYPELSSDLNAGTESRGKNNTQPLDDPMIWGWEGKDGMEKFTGSTRKTIEARAGRLDITIQHNKKDKGKAGLRESDLRRIMVKR